MELSNYGREDDRNRKVFHKKLSSEAVGQEEEYVNHCKWKPYRKSRTRMLSFDSANGLLKRQSTALAENGFFFKGYGFMVMCFCCGLDLDLQNTDGDFCFLHRTKSPDCRYLIYIENERKEKEKECKLESSTGSPPVNQQVPVGQMPEASVTTTSTSEERVTSNTDTIMQCKICLDRNLSTMFIPCKHLASCDVCARRLHQCPICRSRISEKIQIYLS